MLALVNSFQTSVYVSIIAKAVILPLFLISIVDFLHKIKQKAKQILLEKINEAHANYREAKAIYDNISPYEKYDKEGKVQGWREEVERNSNVMVHNYSVDMQIENYFKWFLPIYTICIFFLLLSLLFAQYPEWILFIKNVNDDTLTLWTFVLLLGDISFTDFLALKLIKYIENKKNFNV